MFWFGSTCLDEGVVYVRFEMRLGISRSLGVNPARTRLSELAMHSMHSVMAVLEDERCPNSESLWIVVGSKTYHRKYRHVARQHLKNGLSRINRT